ncbi:kinase domain protein, putative (macronuclear) [Tetrahymena thermophila SB210]|uniref:Kinase domain protein, putative n=1 Tax=Tetrahymena thermophila (strain SB210) TaxID=312017 RepID=W7XK23_TETTS|nr:kinase domain protein, putative [Tetrahymena thermophila SB210]EWS76151.1 kinase domain protein, putative [Tetrahymena thermophila SB210]|eukprot:XP_012651304.1 kinase domain protein, putative [Tetrahymena thermophila SB210]
MIEKKYKSYLNIQFYAQDKYSLALKATNKKNNQALILLVSQYNDYQLLKNSKYLVLDQTYNQLFPEDNSQVLNTFQISESKPNLSCGLAKNSNINNQKYFLQQIKFTDFSLSLKQKATIKKALLQDLEDNHHLVQQVQAVINGPDKPFKYVEWCNGITSKISKCVNMESFEVIFQEEFQGKSLFSHLASALSNCQFLIRISLNLNQCSKIKIEDLCCFIQAIINFPNVSSFCLNLSQQIIENEDIELLGKTLSQFTQLEIFELNCENSNIDDKNIVYFSEIFTNCKLIKNLNLNLKKNSLCNSGIIQLGQKINKCENLKHLNLNLYANSLLEESVLGITFAIKNKNLISLQLEFSINILGDVGINNLCNAISKCATLKKLFLDFCYNNISQEGVKQLGRDFIQLTNLSNLTLKLDWNIILFEGAKFLIDNLKQVRNINILHLSLIQNSIDQKHFLNIQQKIKKFKRLVNRIIKLTVYD